MEVHQIKLWPKMTVGQLLEEMDKCGVLGAGKLGAATDIVASMFSDRKCKVYLTLAGALVPGGLRNIISMLIKENYVHGIVTTGANIVHDILEALGFKHLRGSFKANDRKLRSEKIGRIGDIYIELKAYEEMENWLKKTISSIPEEIRANISAVRLMKELGLRLKDENSILAVAAERNVPVICPGFMDCVAGFQIWTFADELNLKIDFFGDMETLINMMIEAERVGLIILGGGTPKHFALFASTFREGVDYAVQITMDRPEPGGLSGAKLEEAISWGKIKPSARFITVVCDATIAFPLIIAAALERIKRN